MRNSCPPRLCALRFPRHRPYRMLVPVRRHGHVHLAGSDIDAGRMRLPQRPVRRAGRLARARFVVSPPDLPGRLPLWAPGLDRRSGWDRSAWGVTGGLRLGHCQMHSESTLPFGQCGCHWMANDVTAYFRCWQLFPESPQNYQSFSPVWSRALGRPLCSPGTAQIGRPAPLGFCGSSGSMAARETRPLR